MGMSEGITVQYEEVAVDKHGNVKVHYEKILQIVDHLKQEHNMSEKCEAIKALQMIWSKGCDAQCDAREQQQ
jgi:hypothetical protein